MRTFACARCEKEFQTPGFDHWVLENTKKTKRTSTLEKIKKFQEESIKFIRETKEKKRTTDKKESSIPKTVKKETKKK